MSRAQELVTDHTSSIGIPNPSWSTRGSIPTTGRQNNQLFHFPIDPIDENLPGPCDYNVAGGHNVSSFSNNTMLQRMSPRGNEFGNKPSRTRSSVATIGNAVRDTAEYLIPRDANVSANGEDANNTSTMNNTTASLLDDSLALSKSSRANQTFGSLASNQLSTIGTANKNVISRIPNSSKAVIGNAPRLDYNHKATKNWITANYDHDNLGGPSPQSYKVRSFLLSNKK